MYQFHVMSIHWNSLLKLIPFWCAMNAWLTPQSNKFYHWRWALYTQTVWMKNIFMIYRCENNVIFNSNNAFVTVFQRGSGPDLTTGIGYDLLQSVFETTCIAKRAMCYFFPKISPHRQHQFISKYCKLNRTKSEISIYCSIPFSTEGWGWVRGWCGTMYLQFWVTNCGYGWQPYLIAWPL